MKSMGMCCLAVVLSTIAFSCGELGQSVIPDNPLLGRGNGSGNGNGGGNGSGSGSAVPGIFVPNEAVGAQQLLGDGRNYTGVEDPQLGGAEYKEGVCNVVVSIASHIGSDPGDIDTTLVRYHAPFKAPKRPTGECELTGTRREITLDGSMVVQFQVNWPTSGADQLGKITFGKGKMAIAGCTYRMNPDADQDPDSAEPEEMVVERVAGGWRVSSLPGGTTAECEETGEEVILQFEFDAVENMTGS